MIWLELAHAKRHRRVRIKDSEGALDLSLGLVVSWDPPGVIRVIDTNVFVSGDGFKGIHVLLPKAFFSEYGL
jgi:hypothetical protein